MDETLEDEVPLDESYWIIPHQFLAGETPASPYFEEQTKQKLEALLEAGIRSFIDLTDPEDTLPYADMLFEIAGWYDHEVIYSNYPLVDSLAPDAEQVKTVLDVIDGSLAAGQPVYVHCLAGVGRTGTVVGAYLVRHGLTGDQALEKIKALRQYMPNAWQRSPESDAQVQMVRNWQPGE